MNKHLQPRSHCFTSLALLLLLTACAERVDLYVVMDGSGSIGQQNFNRMKAFLSELVDDLTVSRSMT